jgi:hypothetical protein
MGVIVPPQPAVAGGGGGGGGAPVPAYITEMANQIAKVYPFLQDDEKQAIRDARAAAAVLSDDTLRSIVAPLITSQVIARFGNDRSAAEQAVFALVRDYSQIYYPADGNWATELQNLRNNATLRPNFRTLMGYGTANEVTFDELFTLAKDIRTLTPDVIKGNANYVTAVLRNDDTQLFNNAGKDIYAIGEDALRQALANNATLETRLESLGWTVSVATQVQKDLATAVDAQNKASLALLYGYIRSESKLVYDDGTPLAAYGTSAYSADPGKSLIVQVLGRNIGQVAIEIRDSSNNVVAWTRDPHGCPVVPNTTGDFTIYGYRDFAGADPLKHWLVRTDVHVTATGGGGSSGGGGGTQQGTTVPAGQGGTVTSGNATLEIPANAFPSDVRIQIQRVTNTAGLSLADNERLVSDVFEIVKNISGNFTKPVTITLRFDPNKVDPTKYDLVICWYDSANNKWVPLDNIEVDWAGNRVSGQVDHFTKFAVIAVEKAVVPTTDLTDIKGHWAFNEIVSLVDLKVLSGYPDKTFKPNNDISRAEFATVIVKALKLEAKAGKVFADTANHWAKDFIATANAYGIINGYSDSSFGPNDPITREQMAVMIANALKLSGSSTSISFTDANSISDWAKDAVAVVAEKGIITGYPDGSFKPDGKLTRAEAASVTVRALNNIQ